MYSWLFPSASLRFFPCSAIAAYCFFRVSLDIKILEHIGTKLESGSGVLNQVSSCQATLVDVEGPEKKLRDPDG